MAPSAIPIALAPLALRRVRWVVSPAGTGVVGALTICVALALGTISVLSPAAVGAAASTAHVPFTPQGIVVATREVALLDHPSRGRAIVSVPAGSVMSVGGIVRVAAGLVPRDSYWVRFGAAGAARFGFLPSGSVALSAGAPPYLDVRGLDIAVLLAPRDGVTAPPSGAGSGDSELAAAAAAPPAGAPAAAGSDAVSADGLTISWLPDTVLRWEREIVDAAARYGVDPDLVAIITLVESGGNPRAVSPSGAIGLMQVMPGTASDIARRRGIGAFRVDQLYDPPTAIDFGAWYLAEMLKLFGSTDDPDWAASVALAAAAYNGGPGTVQRHLTAGAALPDEAERYRHWVGTMWAQRSESQSAGYQSWLAAGGRLLVEAAASTAVSG